MAHGRFSEFGRLCERLKVGFKHSTQINFHFPFDIFHSPFKENMSHEDVMPFKRRIVLAMNGK